MNTGWLLREATKAGRAAWLEAAERSQRYPVVIPESNHLLGDTTVLYPFFM